MRKVGGAQRWGYSVDLGASLCTCEGSECKLKSFAFRASFNEKDTSSYEQRSGNDSNDDGRAMVQYGLEGRRVVKGYAMRGWGLSVAIAVA